MPDIDAAVASVTVIVVATAGPRRGRHSGIPGRYGIRPAAPALRKSGDTVSG
jgi:hypothetical protein